MIALRSAWMPAPPPESDPAMVRTRPCSFTLSLPWLEQHRRQGPLRKRSGRGARCLFNRTRQLLHHLLYQLMVFAFTHNPDQGLRAGLPDQQTACRPECRLCILNGRANSRQLQRLAARTIAYIAQKLREGLENIE